MTTFALTQSGREHILSGPAATHPDNVPSLREIAHSLAQINRYTGHASRPYSVAEHSLLVCMFAKADGASNAVAFAALMHDAHEAIVGDVSSQIKIELGEVWAAFEWKHQRHLLEQYELLDAFTQHKAAIKRWDLIALATERRDLMPYTPGISTPWAVLDTPGAEVLPDANINLNAPQRQLNIWQTWAYLFENQAALLQERMAVDAFEAADSAVDLRKAA